jgi:hypothetical protein
VKGGESMQNKFLIVIALVVVAAAGFFGGMKYQQSQSPASGRGNGGQNGAFRQRFGNNPNGQAVRGQIVSADNGTMTVQMRDGSSKIIILSGSTGITKAASGSRDDLKAGEQVMVFGTNNSDGSVTAQMVQLNPMFRGPNASPSGSSTNQ